MIKCCFFENLASALPLTNGALIHSNISSPELFYSKKVFLCGLAALWIKAYRKAPNIRVGSLTELSAEAWPNDCNWYTQSLPATRTAPRTFVERVTNHHFQQPRGSHSLPMWANASYALRYSSKWKSHPFALRPQNVPDTGICSVSREVQICR